MHSHCTYISEQRHEKPVRFYHHMIITSNNLFYRKAFSRPQNRSTAALAWCDLHLNATYIYAFRRSFETEQRKIYRGHDVIKNPVPKSCKLEDEMYHPPHEAMEGETCNKVSAQWNILEEENQKQLNGNQNESVSNLTKLFGANFMQIGLKRRKLLKIENLEKSSWEPDNQWGCDATNSQWILFFFFFFPIMHNKSTIFIKLPHKMIGQLINKGHICKLCVYMHAFEK